MSDDETGRLKRRPMRARLEYIIARQIAAGATPEVIVLAVLTALREPTGAMVDEGFSLTPDDDAVVVWRTMIDAALKD